MSLLTKGNVATRLLDFMPSGKRNASDFKKHFAEAGMEALVEWNTQREIDAAMQELEDALTAAMGDDIEPASVAAVLDIVKSKRAEKELPDAAVLRVLWASMIKTINMTGKSQSQILQAVLSSLKTYRKALAPFASSSKAELALLVQVQVKCYEDNRMLKLFSDIVKLLYNSELVGEDTVLYWYKKGSHPKGRNVFLKDIEPFIKWLEEASEEEEDEEEAAAAAAPAAVAPA